MKAGSVICDISSNSAYTLPSFIIPKKAYLLAETNEAAFLAKLIKRSNMAKTVYEKNGFAYGLSKISFAGMPQKVHSTSVQRESELFLLAPVLLQQIWARWKKNTVDILSNCPVRSVWENQKNSVMLLQL